MPEENSRTSIRSTAVNEIIAHKPGFLIRWGNLIFLLILLLILAASFLIRYPDVVNTGARLLQQNDNYIAEIAIPQDKAAGIKTGQKVLLKFPAYPFREYGTVEGRIDTVYSSGNNITAKVALPNGLTTNYQKKIAYTGGLAAEADVITADIRLSERLIKKMKKSFSE